MYQTILKSAQDIATVREDLKETLRLGAFYGASVDYQQVSWFDEFHDVLKTHRTQTWQRSLSVTATANFYLSKVTLCRR